MAAVFEATPATLFVTKYGWQFWPIPLQASKIATCRMARLRAASGGGVLSARIAASAREFQSVTKSGCEARQRAINVRINRWRFINVGGDGVGRRRRCFNFR